MSNVNSRWSFYRFASPATFYPLAGKLVPWFAAVAAVLAAWGLWLGMLRAPTDATQGDAYRIIFIHVPAAWMSMLLYVVMAFWAAIGWAFNARLASVVARAIAPTGAEQPASSSASTFEAFAPYWLWISPSYCCSLSPATPCENVRPSSWLVPISSGTRVKCPAATAVLGSAGSSAPPHVGESAPG